MYHHRMVGALCHVKLGIEHRIVQCCRDLTHAAAVRLYGRTVLICARQFVSVFRIKRCDRRVYGKLFARIQHGSIDLAHRVFDVCDTGCGRITEIRVVGSKNILYLREGLLVAFRLNDIRN